MTTAEKTAATAFCAAAANLTAETRAAATRAFHAAPQTAARAAEAARQTTARAEALLDAFDPEPYGAGPGGLSNLTFQEVIAAHMALDAAARHATRAADAATRKA